jgi:hypothetical protein
MKLSQEKIKKIEVIILKACEGFKDKYSNNPKFIKFAVDKIVECIQDTRGRSNSEQGLYWIFCKYVAENIPEYVNRLLDIEHLSDKTIHELLKAKYKVTSTAFENMQQDDFNAYFKKIQDWIAMYFFKCTAEKLMDEINRS